MAACGERKKLQAERKKCLTKRASRGRLNKSPRWRKRHRKRMYQMCIRDRVEPMQRCGISALKAQKLCAQQGALSLKREPSGAVSEGQKLKRKSKSLILSLELTQRADFVTRAYTALPRLNVHYSSIGWSCLPCRARSTVSGSFAKSATRDAGFFMGLSLSLIHI